MNYFLQLSVLIGVRYLQTAMKNVLLLGDLEGESDGWLLENSFVETAKYNINIIKNLGKANQISTVSGMNDPNINVQNTDCDKTNITTKSIPAAR